VREKMLGILFVLFIICFLAIIIEEAFLGGRKRRQLARKARSAAEHERQHRPS